MEVACDYDWDAAKVYRDMKESDSSSMVLKAITEAKNRKAVGKKDGGDEKTKKKKVDENNNTAGNRWRGGQYQQYQPPAPQY